MRVAIVAVGSELLGTERLDTNSLRATRLLERYGVALWRKSVLGDQEEALAREVRDLVGRCDLVVFSGGLGPTADDITRTAVASALGRPMFTDEAIVEDLIERFARMGREMPEVNRRQAEVIEGATVLPNDLGSAPGMEVTSDGTTLFLFPGVPIEMDHMLERYLEPWLREHTEGVSRELGTLRVACVPESALEERIAPAYDEFGREDITVLAKPGDIRVQATAVGAAAARRRRLDAMLGRLRELIGDAVYGEGEEISLESVVGELLAARGKTLVTAESCTGGLVSERITRVPGSSAYFLGAAVTYSNELKTALLDVPAGLIGDYGAVSREVAEAMASGARRRLGADYALAITGIAGPGGGTPDKPVGTVHVAVEGPGPGDHAHARLGYPGGRERVRLLSSQVALELLRRMILEL